MSILGFMGRLRFTERELKRVRLEPCPEAAASTTLLGDRYVNLLNAGRSRWILCVSERVLLPIIVPARKATLPDSLVSSLGVVLEELGILAAQIEGEIEMDSTEIHRSRSRQMLGVDSRDQAVRPPSSWIAI